MNTLISTVRKLCFKPTGSNALSELSVTDGGVENTAIESGLIASKKLLLAWLGLALVSCVGPNISNWPESIPQQQFFVDAYLADEANQRLQSRSEYLEWTLSFYQGNLAYQSGWLDIESVVLNIAADRDAGRMAAQLNDLGAAIGVEWAKHNRVRLIDSRMLALWGSALQLADNSEQQKRSIELISRDVNGLLSGGLSKSDIVETRYVEMLQLDFFGGF